MRSHHRVNFRLWRRMNSWNSHARLATSPFSVEFSHIINTCYQTTPTECLCTRLTLRMRISSNFKNRGAMLLYMRMPKRPLEATNIMEYGSTPYVGMARKKNGGHI